MRQKLLAGLTATVLLLSGCAQLLNRDYLHTAPHNTTPTAEGDPSVLRAENYQELVNALVYFVSQGAETGSIRLYVDAEDVDASLAAACLEVVQEDPLGAYAVEHIKYSVDPVVTYYQAEVEITFCRTREQIASVVLATGTTAIRGELESALAAFLPERVLRISYFHEDEEFIRTLCREAYYANPATALGLPEVAVAIYPESGRQRIVEISLAYPLDMQELTRRYELLALACADLIRSLPPASGDQLIISVGQSILSAGAHSETGGSTAYHALLSGGADSQGLALTMALICQRLTIDCRVVQGTLNEQPHFWNVLPTQGGWMHLDLSQLEGWDAPFHPDDTMTQLGYVWDAATMPQDAALPSGEVMD